MNDRPRVFHRLAGRASRLESEAHAQASATLRHEGLLRRLGGRSVSSASTVDVESGLRARSHVLLKVLARRG